MNIKKNAIISLVLILTFLSACGVDTKPKRVQTNPTIKNETSVQAATQPPKELTEDGYKSQCKELFYDEIFFGKEDLENQYVKLHLFLSEKYYFTTDDYHRDDFKRYNDEYNLNKDFYKCCVIHKGTNSYAGQQINMWFSNNTFNPSDYKTGQKIVVYAKVISWSNNTMNGYNKVTIIPKYIEMEN